MNDHRAINALWAIANHAKDQNQLLRDLIGRIDEALPNPPATDADILVDQLKTENDALKARLDRAIKVFEQQKKTIADQEETIQKFSDLTTTYEEQQQTYIALLIEHNIEPPPTQEDKNTK